MNFNDYIYMKLELVRKKNEIVKNKEIDIHPVKSYICLNRNTNELNIINSVNKNFLILSIEV